MNQTITGVPGVSAGHWTDTAGQTGVTVVRCPGGVRGGPVGAGLRPGQS